ncbi:MAG: dihydropteroate synthase [Nevskiales bacterium]
MGILNLTPDSFSDGGRFATPETAVDAAAAMLADGADIIDIGGESTRPGAEAVSEAQELERVVPVIEALRARFAATLSVDTCKPVVMRAAVAAGATMINDVYALRRPGAIDAARELGVPVCLMHMQGEPRTMQQAPAYDDVVSEVRQFLLDRAHACMQAGIARAALVLDPGFGFGKTLQHNLALLRGLRHIAAPGFPVLVGLSRKALIGAVTGRAVGQRIHGSVALAVYAALNGAAIVRVHDVGATVDALKMIAAVAEESLNG